MASASGAPNTTQATGNEAQKSAASQLSANIEKWNRLAHPSTTLYGEGLPQDAGGNKYVPLANYSSEKRGPLEEYIRVLGRGGYYNAGAMGLQQPQVVLPVTKDDLDTIKEREDLSMLKSFHDWIIDKYRPFDDPAEAAWLRTHGLADLYDMWVKENDQLHDLKKQYEKVNILGPQNLEDFQLLWRVEWDPILQEKLQGGTGFQQTNADTSNASFRKGLLNASWWASKLKAMYGINGLTAGRPPENVFPGKAVPRIMAHAGIPTIPGYAPQGPSGAASDKYNVFANAGIPRYGVFNI